MQGRGQAAKSPRCWRSVQRLRQFKSDRPFWAGALCAFVAAILVAGIAVAFVFGVPQRAAVSVGDWFADCYWQIRFRFMDPLEILQSKRGLTMEGALAVAQKLDKYSDQLEDIAPRLAMTQPAVLQLEVEVVPYFNYEGITGPICTRVYSGGALYCSCGVEKYPPVDIMKFRGRDNFHVLGRSFCTMPANYVFFNIRFANPFSPWYESTMVISTLVHELLHANGICYVYDPLLEPTTETATLEVLAAMGISGNDYTFLPFVHKVQDFAIDYAWAKAMSEDRMPEFERAIERMFDTEFSRANWARTKATWQGREGELKRILNLYGKVPYILTVEALQNPSGYTRPVPIPATFNRIRMDDTRYFLGHLPELVGAFITEMAEKEPPVQ